MENGFGVEQSKAFAEGLFQGAQIVTQYMRRRYAIVSDAEGDSKTGYKTSCMKRLWLRAFLWMQTLERLTDPLDVQAISVGNRALLEFLVDLILLSDDRTYKSAAKMFWWGESEKLRASEQIIKFYEEQGLCVPDEFEAQRLFCGTERAKIEKMRETHWPKRKKPKSHPKRWTGKDTLFEDVKEADRLYASVIKPEIGSSLTEYFRTQYAKMNWQIHSGVAGLGDQPPQAFYLTCGFAFRRCADFAMLCTLVMFTDLDFNAAVHGFEQEWKNVRGKQDYVFAEALYKFHSAAQTS